MPSALARHWTLDPEVAFLNHGSFGAAPRAVLDEQQRWRERLEREPVLFLGRQIQGLVDEARAVLAGFLGARVEELAFVPNATTAVNAVLRSLPFAPGDEILVTDQGYNACRNTVEFVAARSGARVVVARVPFPLRSPDEVVEGVLAALTPRTRLALLDHVTSPTGIVFPIERLVRELRERGVPVLVDGAHAPGMLPLDLAALGADYYTGNLHKWVCAPKGAAFLWVREELQERIRPVVISHGANARSDTRSRFQLEFDWVGTDDPTAWLCVPAALRFMGGLFPGGWDELRERNRALALEARSLLAGALGVEPPAPDEMIGTLAALRVPDAASSGPASAFDVDPLQRALFERHRIEVLMPTWPAPPRRWVRISAQAYNAIEDYRALADALRAELGS
jgi:isopenicillin-N epimerase